MDLVDRLVRAVARTEQPQPSTIDCATPRLALAMDLRTEWIPDAVGGRGLGPWVDGVDAPALEDCLEGWLDAPYGLGLRPVPVVGVTWRASLHGAVDRLIGPAENQVAPEVFGYRDAGSSYRDDYRRLRHRLAEAVAMHPFAARVDIARLFESVTLDHCAATGVLDSLTLERLETLKSKTGMVLIPGHRWSRRIANLVLHRIDNAIMGTYFRWQDDYFLFANSEPQLREQVDRIRQAARQCGFSINESKLEIENSAALLSDRIADFPQDIRTITVQIHEASDIPSDLPFIKYGLRLLTEHRDPAAVGMLTKWMDAPILLPRIAHYLSTLPPSDDVSNCVADLLCRARSDWELCRLLPLLAYHTPRPARSLESLNDRASSHRLRAIRELSYVCANGSGKDISQRVRICSGVGRPVLATDL